MYDMEVLEELQISISEAYQAAFEKAHQKLKSQLASNTVELQDANAAASITNEARLKAERRAKDLEREVSALRTELSFHEYSPEDLELQHLAEVQNEFKPNHVFETKSNMDRGALESKYTALYRNMQTLAEICKDLKVANVKHRKHLSQFQRSINSKEFTVLIEGAPVTYQRISPTPNADGKKGTPEHSRNSSSSQLGFLESKATPRPNQNIRGLVAQKAVATAPYIQSPSIRTESESPESNSDVHLSLPDLKTKKRRRDDQTTGSVPERSLPPKTEPMTSSPTHYSAYLPSTQDLDDIGDTVQTPTKRQTHRMVHWMDPTPKRRKREPPPNYGVLTEDGETGGGAHTHPVRDETMVNATLQALLEGSAPISQTKPEVRPEDEPFRSLPLQLQNLEHFKINPDRNEGIDYAYNDVVRRKDDRRCLAGCTRPGCCGDRFRAMARIGAPEGLSANQEEEEQRILEEYVGDQRNLLNGLSPRDRANLLVEARARTFANQYGRHRHTHQRAQTPPGFWRTEMPSTQEQEADRKAARRLEREKVEERYREAMRPGGLWIFADE